MSSDDFGTFTAFELTTGSGESEKATTAMNQNFSLGQNVIKRISKYKYKTLQLIIQM